MQSFVRVYWRRHFWGKSSVQALRLDEACLPHYEPQEIVWGGGDKIGVKFSANPDWFILPNTPAQHIVRDEVGSYHCR